MLSIGEFSRAGQVTIKALHHYDKLDLLKPAYIDPQSGYRYYESSQIEQLLLIQRLKRYGFSLSQIQQFLSTQNPEIRIAQLSAQKQLLKEKIKESRLILHELEEYLDEFERTGNIMSYQNRYQITLKQTEDLPVISARQQMSVEQFGYYCGKLMERVARDHIAITGHMMALYHDRQFDPEQADIEIALPAADPAQSDRTVPGCLCASTVHHGAYSTISEAYGALTKWITDNGYDIVNAPYDIYQVGPNNSTDPETWETVIYFPIQKRC